MHLKKIKYAVKVKDALFHEKLLIYQIHIFISSLYRQLFCLYGLDKNFKPIYYRNVCISFPIDRI